MDHIPYIEIIKNDHLTQQYQLYALSKLKYENNNTFLRYILFLSGDVEPNPGPENLCVVCEKIVCARQQSFAAGNMILGYTKNVQIYWNPCINQ